MRDAGCGLRNRRKFPFSASIDIGPNAVNRVQNVVAHDHSNYKVQYAAINYNAKAPQNLCVPIASVTKVIEDELKSGIIYL